jgi:hypothetical protein
MNIWILCAELTKLRTGTSADLSKTDPVHSKGEIVTLKRLNSGQQMVSNNHLLLAQLINAKS